MTTVSVEVFDPPMCCSTGVCGPSVDPALATFAADLTWLGEQGVKVVRHNLSQEPKSFAESEIIRQLLAEQGNDALPAVVVEGQLKSSGRYPTRNELREWAFGVEASVDQLDSVTAELVALGAAVVVGCETCFKYHYDKSLDLGVSKVKMSAAVKVAQTVRDTSERSISELVDSLLGGDTKSSVGPVFIDENNSTTSSGFTESSCCGGSAAKSSSIPVNVGVSSSKCCG